MIVSFWDAGTEDVYHGRSTASARRTCPESLLAVARRKLNQLSWAETLDDLRAPPGNRLEKLTGDRDGEHSIRINDRYRVCFRWADEGPAEVEIVDYHR